MPLEEWFLYCIEIALASVAIAKFSQLGLVDFVNESRSLRCWDVKNYCWLQSALLQLTETETVCHFLHWVPGPGAVSSSGGLQLSLRQHCYFWLLCWEQQHPKGDDAWRISFFHLKHCIGSKIQNPFLFHISALAVCLSALKNGSRKKEALFTC